MADDGFARTGWILTGGVVAVASIAAYCLNYSVGNTGSNILTTLALAQASIFAIVFSILVFGIRFSASRYSPRIATEFTKDKSYRWTVGVFAGSIGYDILLLYLVDSISNLHFTILTIVAAGLAVAAFWKLYDFVNETLEKTTPEGILTQLRENLTPETILEEAEESAQEPTNRDPFIILISVIRSAVEQADRVSASMGLDILEDAISDLLRTAPENEFQEGTAVDQSLENVFVDNLPTIVDEALDEEVTQIAIESTEAAEGVGETAIVEELDRPLELVVRGQTDLIDRIGYSSDEERVRIEAIDVSRGLARDAADAGLFNSSAIGARLLGWISAASIMNRNPDQRYDGRYTTLLINGFPKILGRALDSDPSLTDYRNTAWLERDLQDVDPVDLLVWGCYDSMAELTAAGIRYEMRIEARFLNWSHVAYGWTEGFELLQDTDLDVLPRIWFGTILYLSYIAEYTSDDVMPDFDPRALFSVDNEFAIDTIEMILNRDIRPTSRINHIPGGVNPLEHPRTGSPSPVVRDADMNWHDWLEQRLEVYRRTSDAQGGFGPLADDLDIEDMQDDPLEDDEAEDSEE